LEKILITTPDSFSAILVGARWEAVVKLLPESNVAIVTDNNVYKIYGNYFPRFPVLKIRPGEESKQLKVIESLAKDLLKARIDRSGFILGVGGGVVCDLTGFLASVFMRGIRCGYVSTSLLSQVDASTGGKNGVNLGEIKNIIGNIRQPEFVICDTTMLRTLPEDEYLSGLAELIKTGIIGNPAIIDILEKNQAEIIRRDKSLLTELVSLSVKYKASVVSSDEKETGLRRVLNFGHTFGHAIELHESVKHGFAVASGIEVATYFSKEKGYLKVKECDRIVNILKKYNLLRKHKISAGSIKNLILHDKKKEGNEIYFVFIKGLGKPAVEKLRVEEVINFYRRFETE
jgi:3-dehydroquinate synthase